MNIYTKARVPDEVMAQRWLEHVRAFKAAHPECVFDLEIRGPDTALDIVGDFVLKQIEDEEDEPKVPGNITFIRDGESDLN